ncbi:UdgX family uracil-DNA binding protein [Paracoccus sp. TOH]|uniref:UdgX family uracil-DNA binding protein n=1 Tax=Paracoccus sp. TOH TaxID=1263728 RepID=UPI0025AF73E3|nr:UdgX family uracil-DNA binding protein [Paracoccus sp. TOH]WJS86650.1 UdgX family uracil-DNA binding protein [Paracoccus sp. TOH]
MSDAEVVADSLGALAEAETACTRCPLYRNATQVVPGEGHRQARMMVVGEQPGDKEDLAGRPFVGPAGRLFDQVLAEAGIPRDRIFVTNAVKHFKFEPRGKRRLHRSPNAGEIDRCRWWLGQELKLVAPAVLVAMGASALRSLLGRPATIASLRGAIREIEGGTPLIATIHPSLLLRLRDAEARDRERAQFMADLQRAWQLTG